MNKFNSIINLFFGHGQPNQGYKKIWRFIFILIIFPSLTYFMPGHLTSSFSTGYAFVLYFGSLVYFDKTSLTKTLAISFKKQVTYTYFVTFFIISVISLILYTLLMVSNIAIGKSMFVFTSVNELATFAIMSCILYLFFVPLCFILKNWIWNTYFFTASIIFLVMNILIDMIDSENIKLLITLIILIAVIYVSYKFSCIFNRPKRYPIRRNVA